MVCPGEEAGVTPLRARRSDPVHLPRHSLLPSAIPAFALALALALALVLFAVPQGVYTTSERRVKAGRRRSIPEDHHGIEIMDSAKVANYTWHWPSSLLEPLPGKRSPFVREHRVSLKVQACWKDKVPDAAYYTDPPPLFNESNVELQQLTANSSKFHLYQAAFGLGNTLRGYASTFVFALLSGRRLVRWHGGHTKGVLDPMCAGFKCGGAKLVNYKRDEDVKQLAKHLDRGELKKPSTEMFLYDTSLATLTDMGDYFDEYWRLKEELKECVFSATGCSSEWCVHSVALEYLLGRGPTDGLAQTIEQDLRYHGVVNWTDPLRGRHLNRRLGEVRGPTATGSGAEVKSEEAVHPQLEQNRGEQSHEAPGSVGQTLVSVKRKEGIQKLKEGVPALSAQPPNDSGCIQGSACSQSIAPPAPDAAQQREPSTGEKAPVLEGKHGVKNRPGPMTVAENRIPKGTAFRLQFDVAVHIRTVTTIVERPESGKDEHVETGKSTVSQFLNANVWHCFSYLLTELQRKKGDSLRTSQLEPLNILLATDHEKFRLRFVERLSKHGVVFFSSCRVAHTSKSEDVEAKFSAISEFYLLSRAAVVLIFDTRISSFSLMASLFSNCTLLVRAYGEACHFMIHHLAELQ